MTSIAKEEKFSQGSMGKARKLSFNEKRRLLMDFMNMRANPEKNRTF